MSVRQSTADHGDGMGLDKDEPRKSNKSRRGTSFHWKKSKEDAQNHGLSLDLFTEAASGFEDNHVLKKLLEEALNAAVPAASARTSGTGGALRGIAKITPSVDMMNMKPPVAAQANHTPMLKLWRSRPDVIVYGVVSDWSQ